MIRYELADDIGAAIKEIIHTLHMTHIDGSRVVCVRSRDTTSTRVIARCHGLSRIMQLALNLKPHYLIEVVSERFDQLKKEEQIKVLIHELMHIPHSFGGGFRAHRSYVTKKKVEMMYKKFVEATRTYYMTLVQCVHNSYSAGIIRYHYLLQFLGKPVKCPLIKRRDTKAASVRAFPYNVEKNGCEKEKGHQLRFYLLRHDVV